MRDKSHSEQIERWAKFVRDNPNKWKAEFKKFSDAQIIMARNFYKRLSKTKGGMKKIALLRGI